MNSVKKDIISLEYQLVEAIKTSDTDFLEKILHEDLLFMAPNGMIVTRAMDLASHKAGDMVVISLTPQVEQINLLGENALSVMVYDTKGTMMGQPIEGKFRYIRVWKSGEKGWQVIGGACMQIQ